MRALLAGLVALAIAAPALGATKFYLHEVGSSIPGYKTMDTTIGGGVTSGVTNTIAGPNNGVQMTKTAGGTLVSFISCPVNAVTISGTATFNIWAFESINSANAGAEVRLYKYVNNIGAAFLSSEKGTELPTSAAAQNWTAVPSQSFADGDRIVVKVWFNDAGGNMSAGRQTTANYDGTTGGAAGDTWVQFTETIGCVPPVAPIFFDDFGLGNLLNSWTLTNTPAIVRDDNHEWLRINNTVNLTQYAEHAISGGNTNYTLAWYFQPESAPAGTGTEQHLLSTRASPGSMTRVTWGNDRKLRVYFKDTNKECTQNSLYKYTECTVDGDCPSDVGGNPGEAACTRANFATSERIALSSLRRAAVVFSASTGGSRPYDVTQSLWIDGYNRGERTRPQGTCTGSTGTTNTNGKACGATATASGATAACETICTGINTLYGAGTCTAAGTCTGTSQPTGNVTAIRVGTDITNLPAIDVKISDVSLVASDTDRYARFNKGVDLFPASDSGTNLWADSGSTACAVHADCEDDMEVTTFVPDGDVTTLQDSSNADEIWNLTDYTFGSGELPVAIFAQANGTETNENGSTGKNLVVGLRNAGAGETLGTAVDLGAFTDGGTYRSIDGPLTSTMPGGGTLDFNALRGLIRKTGTTGTSFRIRVTNYTAQAVVALPQPIITDYFPDVNADDDKRLCIHGDSIMNDPELYDATNALNAEVTSILQCAKGGQLIYDLDQVFSDNLDGNGWCIAQRGASGNCDVNIVHIGANDFSNVVDQINATGYCFQRGCVGGSNAGKACKTTAVDCPGGTCTDRAGPQQGAACEIHDGTYASGDESSTCRPSYCTDGDNIGELCAGCVTGVNCAGQYGDCFKAGIGHTGTLCTVATQATDCAAGYICSQFSGYGSSDLTDSDSAYRAGLCQFGEPNASGCPLGTCLHQTTTANFTKMIQHMVDTANARTGSAKVITVLAGNTEPLNHQFKTCVGGTNNGGGALSATSAGGVAYNYCLTNTDCTSPGKCKQTLVSGHGAWPANRETFLWADRYLRAFARTNDLPYISLGEYERVQTGNNPDAGLRDSIHKNEDGQIRMAEIISACTTRDTSVPQNLCGDLQARSMGLNTCPTAPDGLVPISTASSAAQNDLLVGSPWCTPTAQQCVDAIVIHVANAPVPSAHLRASIGTITAGLPPTWAKLNAGCDTASTDVVIAGWQVLETLDSSACVLSAATNYFPVVNTDDATLAYTTSVNGAGYRTSNAASTYGSGIPAGPTDMTFPFTTKSYAIYFRVHPC